MVMPQPLHIISHDLQDTITTTPPEVPRRRVFSTKCVDDSVRSESGPNSPVSPKSHQVPICTGSTSNPSLPTSPVQQSTVLQSSRSRSKSWKSLPSMASNHGQGVLEQEKHSLLQDSPLGSSRNDSRSSPRDSLDSTTTVSTTSLVLENLNANAEGNRGHARKPLEPFEYRDDESDPEIPPPAHVAKWREQSFSKGTHASMSQTLKRLIWVIGIIAVSGWAVALFALLSKKTYQHASNLPYDHETPSKSHGRMITLEDVQHGQWWTHHVNLNWIPGPNGEDGLLLEVQQPGKDFMVVEDVRSRKGETGSDVFPAKTLMKYQGFNLRGSTIPMLAEDYWVSPDLTKVLILTRREKVYRHSFTGIYYILDVATQLAEVLDPNVPDGRVQLATWSPKGNSVVFTRENNLFVRLLKDSAGEDTTAVRQVTTDGGSEYFYGIPDWVYEEEVFENNIATWWDREGRFVAFLRTNETMVPEYSISYYVSRPSGLQPEKGMENYPDEKRIKYPKAGAPNPVVDMLFYDLQANEVFEVDIDDGFADNDRIIGDVLWADDGKVLVKEVNRVSDKIRVVLVDVNSRTGKQVRKTDVRELDGGWVEPGQESQYVPADPANGRDQDGYIDLVIHDNGDHLGYFSPIDSAEPLMLTSGPWEVEKGTVNLDLKNNLVYFSASKEHSTQRHIYSVDLSGKGIKPIVPTDKPGYYTASFSAQSLYAILNYEGPGIPSQKLVSTPANPNTYSEILEENKDLAKKAASHEMPHLVYTNMTAEDGTVLNILEQRPPHFDPNQQYPVLFQLYGGPGSQSVTRRFSVNFQSYVASSLGYLVVTLDNRGTGFIGRKARTLVRGNLGRIEATDQIAAAKMYAAKKYVDANRLAIWGWSYGGFMTLKVLEMDAGQTFRYGMAVAPVTDWADYDSIYTERYMLTPQENPSGYADTAISNVTALSHNVRWLMMHGTGDDNVHIQNTLQLIDKLDLEGIKNYDVHFFPDSDHGIYFHGANEVVYGKLNAFLINAFNGEFYKMNNPTPDYVAGIDG